MLTLTEVNQRQPRCQQCGCLSDLVEPVEAGQRVALYGTYYLKNKFPQFVQQLRDFTGCSVGEAKATYLHLAAAKRLCHRCNLPLALGVIVDCEKCNSLNLVWEEG